MAPRGTALCLGIALLMGSLDAAACSVYPDADWPGATDLATLKTSQQRLERFRERFSAGALISFVKITVTNRATGLDFTAEADSGGNYPATLLPAGHYRAPNFVNTYSMEYNLTVQRELPATMVLNSAMNDRRDVAKPHKPKAGKSCHSETQHRSLPFWHY